MITFFYIGEPRFREHTVTNHEKLFEIVRSNWPMQVLDYTHLFYDRELCPFDRSGAIQVWDFYKVLENVKNHIVVKLRTDVWFDETAYDVVLQELTKIISGEHDISFIGSELFRSFDQEYERIRVPLVPKVQDFVVIADKRKIKSQDLAMHDLEHGKPFKSGNRTWQFIIADEERAYTIRCQMFLVRQNHAELNTWQVAYDFIRDFKKCEKALAWWELKKPIAS